MLSLYYWVLFFIITFAVTVTGKKGFGPGSQEYGYVEVRKGAHMFYWLYYKNTVKEHEATKHPLVIWLQGGPGGSSTGFGNFAELGTLNTNLTEREFAWTKHVNVLFIDNPVGTGFSYVENQSLFVKNNDEVSADLVTFTKAFYKKFKKFKKSPLYIFSESYGGKMTIQFAYDLYKEIKKHKLNINFKGVALGDSWISPVDSCLTWAPYLLNIGEVDMEGYNKINKVAQQLKTQVETGQWEQATRTWGSLELAVIAATYGVDFYNILYGSDYEENVSNDIKESKNYGRILIQRKYENEPVSTIMDKVKTTFKSVIPSSVEWGAQSGEVFDYLNEDFMKPVTNYVEKVLNETNLAVVVYSGQLDLIVDTPGTLNWVERLKWPGADMWEVSDRAVFLVDNRNEGFVKNYEKFTFYWINRAGHMVPSDNPVAALKMLQEVTGYTN